MRLTEDTRLADLRLAPEQLAVALDEVFLIPSVELFPDVPQPVTIGEVARRTRLSGAEVIARLERIVKMSEDIEISCEELKGALAVASEGTDALVMVDVRQQWEWDVCHLPGSILLAAVDFQELLPRLRDAKSVVAICHHGVRSYSAAMFLRQNGVAARSLTGGLEEWAQTIDRTMARY